MHSALIPRKLLLGPQDYLLPKVSPDGSMLAYLAPVNDLLNIWIAPLQRPQDAQPITRDQERPIFEFTWAHTNRHLLYRQDKGGDEDWHVYSIDINTKCVLNLTPESGISARLQQLSHKFPYEVLVGINGRDTVYHDLYRIHVETGERQLVFENRMFSQLSIDHEFCVRYGYRVEEDGSESVHLHDGNGGFAETRRMPTEDYFSWYHITFDTEGRTEYWVDSRGRNTNALVATDLTTGKTRVLASDEQADITDYTLHPTKKTVQAVAYTYTKKVWHAIDPEVGVDLSYLNGVTEGQISILSRSDDDAHWTIECEVDNGPIRFLHYDRKARQLRLLSVHRKRIEGLQLVRTNSVTIPSRDGRSLVSYLTLPHDTNDNDRPQQALPMVLFVHGGPWSRDTWGFNNKWQWLANRGYAVLCVNYRGSTGFGKDFISAGDREWGARMQDDLIDAVDWAVKEGIADRERVAIMGASYGGYATLLGLSMTPDIFACGVCFFGISNLVTCLESFPPYWKTWSQIWKLRTGDWSTEEGRAFLLSRSPITYVNDIQRPLLMAHGANDVRCKQAEADQMTSAMRDRNIPVTYLLYPDEGHGFARPTNLISALAVTENFLAHHLGGRAEPIGDAFAEASVQVMMDTQGILTTTN